MLRKIGSKLANLLTDSGQSHATAPTARVNDGLVLSREEFERHLQSVVKSNPQTLPLAGRVNFIGLSKIREKLGDRWGHVAERADEITRRAIERRLANADVYTRYKELHYLLVFAQLSKEQAQLKCALIAEEITKRLLGDDIAPELLEVKTMVSPVGDDLNFEDVPSIEELASRLAGEATDGVEVTAGNEEDRWWDGGEDPTEDPIAGVQLVYRPMWNVLRKAVTTYVCVPARVGAGGQFFCGEAQMPRLTSPEIMRRLDFLVQRRVITDLRKIVATNQRQLLCLPVHFETMASVNSRNEYMEFCRRGIPEAGKHLLVFELTGVPAGLPPSRLLDLASMLRRFGRSMLLRTTAQHTVFHSPSETGVTALGYETELDNVGEPRQMQNMARFVAAAKKAGLATYIHGIRTLSLTTAAIGAGFDFVDGDVVISLVDQPRGAYAFELANIFEPQFRPAA